MRCPPDQIEGSTLQGKLSGASACSCDSGAALLCVCRSTVDLTEAGPLGSLCLHRQSGADRQEQRAETASEHSHRDTALTHQDAVQSRRTSASSLLQGPHLPSGTAALGCLKFPRLRDNAHSAACVQALPPAHRWHRPRGALQVVCAETSRRSSSTTTKKRAGAPPLPPIDDTVGGSQACSWAVQALRV